MKQTVTMPALSDTMNEGRLSRWLKQPGDKVSKGDVLAEVETDKAVMEVEAFQDGYLAGPLAPVDSDLPVGAPIAYITDEPQTGASAPTAKKTAAKQAAPKKPSKKPAAEEPAPQKPAPKKSAKKRVLPEPAAAKTVSPPPSAHAPEKPGTAPAAEPQAASGFVPASPYARALARDLGIDLAAIARGEPGPVDAGVLLKAVLKPPAPNLEEGPPYKLERLSPLRDAVARNMIGSLTTPTFRLVAELPLRPLQDVAKQKQVSLNLLLAFACGLTVAEHPLFNAVYTPDGLAKRERIDIGIAVDLPEGLITPVLRDVANRSLSALKKDWMALLHKAKQRKLVPEDYRGATFYLSDLGNHSVVRSFDSLIPLGASAILSVGAANGDTATFTLACDHRVIFGADGARFLATLESWLSEPARLSS